MFQTNLNDDFNALDVALGTLELTKNSREKIYGQLAAILHIGNVKFEDDNNALVEISSGSKKSLDIAAKLLLVDAEQLASALLKKRLNISNEQNLL